MIDATRHASVFSPASFGNKRVDVIGAGATGSSVAYELAKLGVTNLHVWDFDLVEEHNLANQMYGPKHCGKSKVDALSEVIKDATGTEIIAHNTRVEKGVRIAGQYVFLLVDSMSARRDIMQSCLYHNIVTTGCIETRMGVSHGFVYSLNPNSPNQVKNWLDGLWTDEVADDNHCGTSVTVGATAKFISSIAIWQWINMVAGETPPFEIIASLSPPTMTTRSFTL